MTRHELILLLMKKGGWYRTTQISSAAIGGSEGMRRLRELRKRLKAGKVNGYIGIEKRPLKGSTQWEYRLIPSGQKELYE
ncbi:MAG: hypothetical protein V3W28_08280 [Thermoplasmata archaeon]